MEAEAGKRMFETAKEIFPICRSITGDGVRKTLNIIKEKLYNKEVFSISEVPSGTQVYDWTVPKEWEIEDAYIEDEHGSRIIDFRKNNLHVVGYSVPADCWMDLEELKQIIYTQPEQPDVIPYVTSYYKESYGFCMSEKQKSQLKQGKYHILIKSRLFDGSLTYAEAKIPGESKNEVFFSTYICHPSMANNECSGPSLATELINHILKMKERKMSYRFVFVPETIGAITYLATQNHLGELKRKVKAGFNLSCVGDDLDYSIVESKYADTLADKVLLNILNYEVGKNNYSRYSYLQRASDERQYGAPGVELPLVTFCRTKFHSYKEYHTSADNMDFVSPAGFQGSYDVMIKVIDALENLAFYKSTVLCEPQLGKRGLYPTTSQKGTKGKAGLYQDILAYADGKNDLLDLSNILEMPVRELIPVIDELVLSGLIAQYKE